MKLRRSRMPPWPAEENLYQRNLGVVRFRNYMRREAQAQVAALDEFRAGRQSVNPAGE